MTDIRAGGGAGKGFRGPTVGRETPGADMTRVLAIANQKGGVGKTTTALTLGAALANRGRRVLVMDLDPHGCASAHMGIFEGTPAGSAADVFRATSPETVPWDGMILRAGTGRL